MIMSTFWANWEPLKRDYCFRLSYCRINRKYSCGNLSLVKFPLVPTNLKINLRHARMVKHCLDMPNRGKKDCLNKMGTRKVEKFPMQNNKVLVRKRKAGLWNYLFTRTSIYRKSFSIKVKLLLKGGRACKHFYDSWSRRVP